MSAAVESLAPRPHASRRGSRPADAQPERASLGVAPRLAAVPPGDEHLPRPVDGSVARPGPACEAPSEGSASGRVAAERAADGPPSVRLAPQVEALARPLRVTTPAHTVPPVLGSTQARERSRPAVVRGPQAEEPAPLAGPMPDPTAVCCAMVQAAVEGLRGVRPLAQLTRWVTPEVYERLLLRAELVQRAGPGPSGRAAIRRIRVFRIGDEVTEASVVVDDGPRVRAVAVRLEAHRGRWRAVAMEIG